MQFSHPRYWPVWVLYASLRLLILFPYGFQVYLGRKLGVLIKKTSAKRRYIAGKNLQICFPEWTDEKREQILTQHFESLGIFLFEFGISCWWPDERIRSLAHIEGLDNLRNALKKNRGVILLASHFTTLVIVRRILLLHEMFHTMYRKIDNELIDHLFRGVADQLNTRLIRHNDLRSMMKSLRSNIPVLYMPDQNFGKRYTVFAPFFGIQAATLTATSRLASTNNIPVVPIRQQRLPDNKGFRVKIMKELDNFPGDNLEQDAARLNRLVEEQVRQCPSEYLWIHRRFKERPPSEKSVY